MIRKFMFLPLVIAVLSIAFFIVAFLTFASRGNHRLIRIKLAIGALIVSFTTFSIPTVSIARAKCYKKPSNDLIRFDNTSYVRGELKINIKTNNTLLCEISIPSSDTFSYRITGENGEENQKGNIEAIDGSFDESSESFEIEISRDITPGVYTLFIYNVAAERQTENLDGYIRRYLLNITN
jgi:hypothetical protein